VANDNLPPVPPLTASGFQDPVWARWLKLLQRRVALSIVDLTVKVANGFSGSTITTGATAAELTLSTTVSGMLKGNAGALVAATPGTDYALPSKYGHFHDTTTQSAAAATNTAITLNTSLYSNGVTIGSPTSRIVFSTPGLYRVFCSLQFSNSSASADDVSVWMRYNGADIAGSAGLATVPSKHGAVNGNLLVTRNDLFLLVTANDYLELYWQTTGGTTSIATFPASGAPVYPSSPGVVLTAQQLN